MSEIKIYTDGSCKGNGKTINVGGFGVFVQDPNHNKSFALAYRSDEPTTNNRMEMKALIYAIAVANKNPSNSYTIYSDSAYCINTAEDWMHKWKAKNWTKNDKKPIENLDLVVKLYDEYTKGTSFAKNFSIVKVKGHSGELGNEIADALAVGDFRRFETLTYMLPAELGDYLPGDYLPLTTITSGKF